MTSAPLPLNEHERLAALKAYDILDSADDPLFDDIVTAAGAIAGTPIAAISLIDETRQWFLAQRGLPVRETSRDVAFCAHTILTPETFVVADAATDARFIDNPLVTGAPHIRFYAGAPLITAGGQELGSLCVIDATPRTLTPQQIGALEALARQVVAVFELRRVTAQLADALSRVKTLASLVPICAWCRKVRDDQDYWQSLETYLEREVGSLVTHGICPSCAEGFDGGDPVTPPPASDPSAGD